MKSSTKKEDWYQFQELANRLLGFSSTKGSGNVQGNGDGLSENFMHECKYRSTQTLSIPKQEWDKFLQECKNHQKKPVFTIIRKNKNTHEMITALRTYDLNSILFSDKVHKNKFINLTIDFLHKKLLELNIDEKKIDNILDEYENLSNNIGI